MAVDFSVLKNINFANPDNILFLVVILVIVIIFLSVFIFIAAKTMKVTKRITMQLLDIEKKPRLNRPGGGNNPSQIKNVEALNDAPKQKTADAGYGVNFSSNKKEAEVEDKKSQKFQRQKSEKEIAEALSKLKPAGVPGGDTMQSKMPSRTAKQEDDKFAAIKIPTPKHFTTANAGGVISPSCGVIAAASAPKIVEQAGQREIEMPKSSDLHGQSLTYGKKEIDASGKPVKTQSNEGGSLFGGSGEISRVKLKHEMKVNPKIWQAQKQAGLSLSPVERANLVKEVFPQAYGSNISKTDLKGGVRKLNQKMLGAKDAQEHAKLRKEINFFKKIGGLK